MTTPAQLDSASKCYCFNEDQFRRVVAYLLDQINSGGGGSCPQDMQVAWTPTSTKLGQELGFFTFGNLPSLTTLTFNQSTSLAGFDIERCTALTSLSFPNLATIDPTDTQGGFLSIQGLSSLTSLSLPLLTFVAGACIIRNDAITSLSIPVLQSVGTSVISGPSNFDLGFLHCATISLPDLVTVGDAFLVDNNAALTSVNLPSLTTIGAVNITSIDATVCPSLATFNAPLWLPTNGSTIDFTGAALNAASVNQVLARGVANAGFVSGTINLNGGTNAAPSGQGVADKATLIGRGVTVNTN